MSKKEVHIIELKGSDVVSYLNTNTGELVNNNTPIPSTYKIVDTDYCIIKRDSFYTTDSCFYKYIYKVGLNSDEIGRLICMVSFLKNGFKDNTLVLENGRYMTRKDLMGILNISYNTLLLLLKKLRDVELVKEIREFDKESRRMVKYICVNPYMFTANTLCKTSIVDNFKNITEGNLFN